MGQRRAHGAVLPGGRPGDQAGAHDRRAARLASGGACRSIAAVGGMVVPALIYLAINAGGAGARRVGDPDGHRHRVRAGRPGARPRVRAAGLRPFLLTLAIVDDIGAIVVIAVFYSGGIEWSPLALAAVALLLIAGVAAIAGPRAARCTSCSGTLFWFAILRVGGACDDRGGHPRAAHPGRAVPASARRERGGASDRRRDADDPFPPDADAMWWLRFASLSKEAVSPLARVEHLLLPWTSFVILPLFALANAGVGCRPPRWRTRCTARRRARHRPRPVVGKIAGIGLAAWVATRLGIARLPAGTRFAHVVGVAAAAGIAFTVSLFVADLAFATRPSSSRAAKIGILACGADRRPDGVTVLLKAAARRRLLSSSSRSIRSFIRPGRRRSPGTGRSARAPPRSCASAAPAARREGTSRAPGVRRRPRRGSPRQRRSANQMPK